MANAKKFRKVGGGFSNAVEKNTLEYDFANDGGLQATLDLGEADEDMVLHSAYAKVLGAVVSGGAPTVALGIGSDGDAIMLATLKGALTLGEVKKGVVATSEQVKILKGDKITLTIAVADLTAGKIAVVLMLSKF